eukprot:7382583-Prymnesium_polylepis.1
MTEAKAIAQNVQTVPTEKNNDTARPRPCPAPHRTESESESESKSPSSNPLPAAGQCQRTACVLVL